MNGMLNLARDAEVGARGRPFDADPFAKVLEVPLLTDGVPPPPGTSEGGRSGREAPARDGASLVLLDSKLPPSFAIASARLAFSLSNSLVSISNGRGGGGKDTRGAGSPGAEVGTVGNEYPLEVAPVTVFSKSSKLGKWSTKSVGDGIPASCSCRERGLPCELPLARPFEAL